MVCNAILLCDCPCRGDRTTDRHRSDGVLCGDNKIRSTACGNDVLTPAIKGEKKKK